MNSKPPFTRSARVTRSVHVILCSLSLMYSTIGCSENPRGDRLPTTAVTGQVTIDGMPVPADQPLRIMCHPLPTSTAASPSTATATAATAAPETAGLTSQSLTGADGRFELSTYQQGDGVPPGQYSLTFFWGKVNVLSGSYDGPDRLKGGYQNPQTSAIKFTVPANGASIDLGEIPLQSGPPVKR